MKNIYIIVLTLFITLFSYSQNNVIQVGDTIHKQIKLSFNDEAVKLNEYLIFEINDDFDFDNLTLLLDGVEHREHTFKVYASKKEVTKKIDFFLKKDASSGEYTFSVKLVDSSNKLKKAGNIEYKGHKEFKPWNAELPKPEWISILIYSILGFTTLILGLFFYKKSLKFNRGTIHLIEPISQNYRLTGKTSFDSLKEKCCIETGISFVLKKAKNGKIKIVNKSSNTVVFINNKLNTKNNVISKNHTIKLVKNNKTIIFKYL